MVQNATVRVVPSEIVDGAYLYVLSKLSTVVCRRDNATFDLCVEISDDNTDADSSQSLSRRFSSSLKRPTSMAQMFALVHQFQLVCVTAGLTTHIAMSIFLDDVIFEPVRTNVLDWPVAFELLICYLRMVENEPTRWRLSNVVAAAGGMDAKRAEAASIAEGLYSAGNFRGPRGEPRDVTSAKFGKGGEEFYKGRITGCNESATKPCAAWNMDNKHLVKHVDPVTGRCLFKHGICDQFVTDKGPGGTCGGNHKRKECTYDKDKKCAKPQK